jgi:hypothetical protein
MRNHTFLSLVYLVAIVSGACSSSNDTTLSTDAAVAGPSTMRCTNADGSAKIELVDPKVCGLASITVEATLQNKGAVVAFEGPGTATASEYGDTLYNAAGPDDDCKYDLEWSSTKVEKNKDITFNLKTTARADKKSVTGAEPSIEAFLDEKTPAPGTNQSAQEKSPGVYNIGPIRFDQAGQWTVRFHIYGQCGDGEASPHGHGAFFVKVQ